MTKKKRFFVNNQTKSAYNYAISGYNYKYITENHYFCHITRKNK